MQFALKIVVLASLMFHQSPSLFAKDGFCKSTIGWLKNIPTIRKVGAQRTEQAVHTASFGRNIPEFTEEQAHTEIENWIDAYRAHPNVRKTTRQGIEQFDERIRDLQIIYDLAHTPKDHEINKGILRERIEQLQTTRDGLDVKTATKEAFILDYRIAQLKETLRLAEQGLLAMPIEIHLGPAPSIELDKAGNEFVNLHSSNELFPGKIKFWSVKNLKKLLDKERAYQIKVQKIEKRDEVDQAIRQWQLETFLSAFTLSPAAEAKADSNITDRKLGENSLVLYREARRLIESQNPDLQPSAEANNKVRNAIAFDQNTANQRLRGGIETLVKPLKMVGSGLKTLHQKLDGLSLPWKVGGAVLLLYGGFNGIWYVTSSGVVAAWNWLNYDKNEREEMEKNERLKKEVFEIAGTSRNMAAFFDRFYENAIRNRRDESIELATEYMLGNRDNLEPDGLYPVTVDPKTGQEINFYKEAKEIVEFFSILVLGKYDEEGNLIVEGAGGKMLRRENNWNNVEQIMEIAKKSGGLRTLLEQFGSGGVIGNQPSPDELVIPDSRSGLSPLKLKNLDNMNKLKGIAEKGGLEDLLNNMGKSRPAKDP